MAENKKNTQPDLNSVIVEGRLVSDPKLTTLPSGTNVCDLRIAVNRGLDKEQNELPTYFFDVKVWNGQGEACAAHLEKGRSVRVQGKLAFREWDDAEKGRQSRTFIVADPFGVRFGPKRNGAAAAAQAQAEGDEIAAAATGDDSDIPF